MRISDWSSDVCSSDLTSRRKFSLLQGRLGLIPVDDDDVLAARGLLRRIAQQAQALQDIKQHGVAHGEDGRAALHAEVLGDDSLLACGQVRMRADLHPEPFLPQRVLQPVRASLAHLADAEATRQQAVLEKRNSVE